MPARRSLRERLLTLFGDIKIYPFPMFLLYDPGSYNVRGEDAREAINRIRPGDIVLRGYRRYLDGYFIPGYFSHAGLYLGKVSDEDRQFVTIERGREMFKPGDQMVVHAMADGVFMEDLLTFCRCDHMAILRFPETIKRIPESEPLSIPLSAFTADEVSIFKYLEAGDEFNFEEAMPVIREVALRQLGREYDFKFDFRSFERLSCTEFVYYCTKSLSLLMSIKPVVKRVFFIRKSMIIPDAYLDAALSLIWCSDSTVDEIRDKIVKPPVTDGS